jgi:hypothetical protein
VWKKYSSTPRSLKFQKGQKGGREDRGGKIGFFHGRGYIPEDDVEAPFSQSPGKVQTRECVVQSLDEIKRAVLSHGPQN